MSKCTHVMDASALLALMNQEPGADAVATLVRKGGVAMCVINLCEVIGKVVDEGKSVDAFLATFEELRIELIDFDRDLAIAAGKLKKQSTPLGLSIGDRACLALASKLSVPAVTSDLVWKKIRGIAVYAIR